jgi:hypothetical protein
MTAATSVRGKVRLLLAGVVGSLILVVAAESARMPPRALLIGDQIVLTIPFERIDPGDRRPR